MGLAKVLTFREHSLTQQDQLKQQESISQRVSLKDLITIKLEQSKVKSSLRVIDREAFMTVTEGSYKTKTGSDQDLIRIGQLSHEMLTDEDEYSVSQESSVGDLKQSAKLKLDIDQLSYLKTHIPNAELYAMA